MNLDLPASIRSQLDHFERRLRAGETAVAILGALGGLLAAYLVLFVSDRFWDTPVVLRALLAGTGLLSVGAAGWFWTQRWILHRRDERQFAVMVQRQYPRLGDRLLGIVELADESKRPDNISPELCRAALEQVAAESAPLDFQRAVPTQPTRRAAWIVATLGMVVLAGLEVLPAAGGNALQRWLRPWARVPRFTLVELTGVAPKMIVPYGEPFEVAGKVSATSRWRPEVARGRFDGQSQLEAPVAAGGFTFRVPGQTQAGKFMVRVGDARMRADVQPIFRPELTALSTIIEFPDYLGYGAVTQDVRSGTLEIVAGARFSVVGRVSRELRAAWWNTNAALAVAGATFQSAALPAETIVLEWQDKFGLRAKTPEILAVKSRPDQSPIVDLQKQPPVVAILEDEVLPVAVAATDDFGVKRIGLSWEGAGGSPVHGDAVLAEGDRHRRQIAGTYRFSPQALGIPPQLVTVRATAVDYFPGREPAQSRGYRVLVLDYAAHAQFVQREFEKFQELLEEITRAEELANDANRQLANLPPEQRTREKRQAQAQAERDNAEKLRRLQEQLAKLLKEALRNRTIPESVLREWARLWEQLQPVPAEWMPAVAEELTRDAMEKVLAKQGEILKRLAELLQQLQDANEAMQAANFGQRLRHAADTEQQIDNAMRQLLPVTAGARLADLPAETRVKVQAVHAQQAGTQQQVRYIRDDLGAFAKRTQPAKYREVSEEMETTQVVDELEKLAGSIAENRGAQVVALAGKWAEQLGLWADKLSQRPGNDSAGNCAGGEMSNAEIELLLKLLRIRQREQSIRETTHSLEDNKTSLSALVENQLSLPRYGELSQALADQQRHLVTEVGTLARRLQAEEWVTLLHQVSGAMQDAAAVLAVPETGAAAVGPETEAIELLSQAGANGSKSAGGAGVGLSLLRQLGLGVGAHGGGSLAGGNPNQPSTEATGRKIENAADKRTVEKSGGTRSAMLPEEFRDALESYFEQWEKLP